MYVSGARFVGRTLLYNPTELLKQEAAKRVGKLSKNRRIRKKQIRRECNKIIDGAIEMLVENIKREYAKNKAEE